MLESALRREIREEADVEVGEDITYLQSGLFDMDDGRKALAVVFLCRYASGARSPGDGEVESVHWMTVEEVRQDTGARPWLKEFMQAVEVARVKDGK